MLRSSRRITRPSSKGDFVPKPNKLTKSQKQAIRQRPPLTAGDRVAAELFKVLRTSGSSSDREAARDALHKGGLI